MKLKEIKDPSIAKSRYDNYDDLKEKVSYEKWIEFINSNLDYYTWLEDTVEGKARIANIDKIPYPFREKIIKLHSRKQALAEINTNKGYYDIVIDYVAEYGKISTTIQKPLTKGHLKRLLEMAKYLDAYLLNNGNDIIDEDVIDSLT